MAGARATPTPCDDRYAAHKRMCSRSSRTCCGSWLRGMFAASRTPSKAAVYVFVELSEQGIKIGLGGSVLGDEFEGLWRPRRLR